MVCHTLWQKMIHASVKISRTKALVRFSRYKAAQEAAPEENRDLNRLKTGCAASQVCERSELAPCRRNSMARFTSNG